MDFEVTIIGAGVIGLAIAARLSSEYHNIVVIEKNKKYGQETSSRNSEVIHSGIYYPSNSLKTKLCVKGKKLLYQYCKNNNVNYNKCGKLLVATSVDDKKQLKSILQQSEANGVEDGRIIGEEEILGIEPHVNAISAIYYPSSGIIDSHGLMRKFETDSLKNGVQYAYNHVVKNLKKIDDGYCVSVFDSKEIFEFTTQILINSSGLEAYNVSSMLGLNLEEYRIYYWKGEYFSVSSTKGKLVNSLIYPVPNKDTLGLGVHATIDLNGRLKLGPNAIFLPTNEIDYSVCYENKFSFYTSAKKYLPFLELNDLEPDQAGIRPKLQKSGDSFRDFIIRNETDYGYHNFINLLGIESPGLTACLSIADYVQKTII